MQKSNYGLSKFFLKLNQLIWKKSFLQKFRAIFYYVDSVLLIGLRFPKSIKPDPIKKNVLVVYNMALGDGIMFMGVAENLRKIYPQEQYHLTIACQKAFAQLYENSRIFDEVRKFDFSGSVVNLKKRRELFKELRRYSYDILIDPIGCEKATMNMFVSRAAIAKKKIGVLDVTLPTQQCPKYIQRKIYTQIYQVKKKNLHLIQFYAEFFTQLSDSKLSCQAHPAHINTVELSVEIPENFFIVFPTASMGVKRWSSENFAVVAQKIYDYTKLPLLVCGTKHDEPVIREFLAKLSGIPVVNIIGKTDIMEFIEVIGRASLILTNDTSAYHIGVAKQVDTFLICGGYTYDRYAHYHYEEQGYKDPYLIYKEMECYNCDNHCKYNNVDLFPCIANITPKKAWETVQNILVKENINAD